VTAPVVVQPDLEAWVIAALRGLPGDVTAFIYAATQLDPLGWLYAHFVQVDARHRRKPAARDIAERARQIIVGLAEVPWPEGVICMVRPTEGPFWLPDPEDGQPRYTTRFEIRVHPVRPDAGALTEGA
jgi:hypothetical protein